MLQLMTAEEAELMLNVVRVNMVRATFIPQTFANLRAERGLEEFDRQPPIAELISPLIPIIGGGDCLGLGGGLMVWGQVVAAGATVVSPSDLFPYPFTITHIVIKADVAFPLSGAIRIKIASDVDTTGGLNTSGNLITLAGTVGLSIQPSTAAEQWFPNVIVRQADRSIKVIMDNQTVADITYSVVMTVTRLA